MTEQQVQALLVRAVKTFAWAFLATLATGIMNVTDTSTLKALAVAGVAAGISAVANYFIRPEEAK